VYVGGGIVPALGAYFERSGFRARFEAKGRFSAYLAGIPTYVIRAPYAALSGAARPSTAPPQHHPCHPRQPSDPRKEAPQPPQQDQRPQAAASQVDTGRISPEELAALMHATHGNPFAVLGPTRPAHARCCGRCCPARWR
jgi:hypothetical protein